MRELLELVKSNIVSEKYQLRRLQREGWVLNILFWVLLAIAFFAKIHTLLIVAIGAGIANAVWDHRIQLVRFNIIHLDGVCLGLTGRINGKG